VERRFSPRDLGLTCRMAVALSGIGLIYTALLAFAGWLRAADERPDKAARS